MKNLPDESLQQLIWSHIDGTLPEAEFPSLQERLRDDPIARSFYLRCSSMQSVLHWEHASMEEVPVPTQAPEEQVRPAEIIPLWSWIEKTGFFPIATAAAFALVFTVLGVSFLKQEDKLLEEIALVNGAVEEEGDLGWIAPVDSSSVVFISGDGKESGYYKNDKLEKPGQSLVFHFANPIQVGS